MKSRFKQKCENESDNNNTSESIASDVSKIISSNSSLDLSVLSRVRVFQLAFYGTCLVFIALHNDDVYLGPDKSKTERNFNVTLCKSFLKGLTDLGPRFYI